MPRGYRTDPDLKARVIAASIKAAREGIPAWCVAAWYDLPARTLHTWLRDNPDAYQARLIAIENHSRFMRTQGEVLRDGQLKARKSMALRRLKLYRAEHGIESAQAATA